MYFKFNKSKGQTFVEYVLIIAFVGLVLATASSDLIEGIKINFWNGLQGTNATKVDMPQAPDNDTKDPDMPTAVISGPTYAHVGDTITFEDESYVQEGRIVRTSWGNKKDRETYHDEGQYNISLTVWTNNGLSDTANVTVYVANKAPFAIINLNPSDKFNIGDTIKISAADSYDEDNDAIDSYKWTYDGEIKEDWEKDNTVVLTSGNHTITLEVRDSLGKWSASETKTIVTNRKPIANIKLPYHIRVNQDISINSDGSYDPDGDKIINEEWTGSYKTKFTTVGTYNVSLRVQDEHGMWSDKITDVFTVNENKPPEKPIITISPNSSIEDDTDVLIDAKANDPEGDTVSYIWTNRDNIISKYTYGVHTVSVIAVDQYGAQSESVSLKFLVNKSSFEGSAGIQSTYTSIYKDSPTGKYFKNITLSLNTKIGYQSTLGSYTIYAYNIKTKTLETLKTGMLYSRSYNNKISIPLSLDTYDHISVSYRDYGYSYFSKSSYLTYEFDY